MQVGYSFVKNLSEHLKNSTAITAELRSIPFYTLAAIHTLYFRLHNQFADELHKLNPSWNDEKLYQESRRIVIALHQHVVYNEWIPTLFGNFIFLEQTHAEVTNLLRRIEFCCRTQFKFS